MMQAAKSWHRYDSAACFGILLSLTSGRCSLRQREMRQVFVIIANVLPHQAFQMPVPTENSVRTENAEVPSIHEILVRSR
jgi:hypothetical protein